MTAETISVKTCEQSNINTLRQSLPQILAVSVKNVLLLAFGMSLGYPTVLIPSLSGGNPQETIVLDRDAISWIGSVNLLCVPLGCLLSGFLTQPLGRRRTMQLVNIPFLSAWLLFSQATKSWHVFLASCMTGFSGGLLEAPTLTYLAEVTTPNLRGILASTSTVAVISGILLEFLLGTFLNWRKVALVSAAVPIFSCVLLFFVPESPYWLIFKGRVLDAQKSMAWLRGWVDLEAVQTEFKEFYEQLIQESFKGSTEELKGWKNLKENSKLYSKKSFLWPFSLVSFVFFLSHFSGLTTLQTYAVSIFTTLEVPINKYYATIMVGVAEMLGCILSSFLVHFVGKRRMNFFSLFGTSLCFCVVATYAYLHEITILLTLTPGKELTPDDRNWVPLTFLILAAFCSHTGIRILPWMLIGEVYHNKIRAPASGFSSAASYILGFMANKIFFSMVITMTLSGTFWFYSGVSLIGLVTLYFWLPETEGKSLFEITEHFRGGTKLNNQVTNFIQMKRLKHRQNGNTGGEINSAFDNKDEIINIRL
ncbi:hypothetical protein ABEB36_011875 [Hypothenemus hampei]|uniref:Major facilitator superfamily (MFS) profile domain-containing protein n=1 Tax=Hypothenemus hampei TaxID=57062 RepID=A0ABD1EC02_HYPHA